MKSIDASGFIQGLFILVIASAFFAGQLLMFRNRFHVDPERMKDPENVKRFAKKIAFLPPDLLTVSGRKRRKLALTLYALALLGFGTLYIWVKFRRAG